MFDVRLSLTQKPPFMLDTKTEELFTHERYADFNMMLGFGDGDIKHIDMRTGQILHTTSDPYVDGIGSIVYNANSNAFVTSGYTDFSVWNIDDATGEARVWSHSHPSATAAVDSGGDYTTNAVFAEDDLILVTSSAGTIETFRQEFDIV